MSLPGQCSALSKDNASLLGLYADQCVYPLSGDSVVLIMHRQSIDFFFKKVYYSWSAS